MLVVAKMMRNATAAPREGQNSHNLSGSGMMMHWTMVEFDELAIAVSRYLPTECDELMNEFLESP